MELFQIIHMIGTFWRQWPKANLLLLLSTKVSQCDKLEWIRIKICSRLQFLPMEQNTFAPLTDLWLSNGSKPKRQLPSFSELVESAASQPLLLITVWFGHRETPPPASRTRTRAPVRTRDSSEEEQWQTQGVAAAGSTPTLQDWTTRLKMKLVSFLWIPLPAQPDPTTWQRRATKSMSLGFFIKPDNGNIHLEKSFKYHWKVLTLSWDCFKMDSSWERRVKEIFSHV